MSGPQSQRWLGAAMKHVARGLSEMTGHKINTDTPRLCAVPITQVATRVDDPETKVVGIYLQIEGGLCGQTILILPMTSALNLADWLIGVAPGTTTNIGPIEHSALAEAGNLAVSYFLNAVALLAGMTEPLRPSAPAVVVDMLGSILNLVVTPVVAARSDDLLIVETVFRSRTKSVQAHFWVLPDRNN